MQKELIEDEITKLMDECSKLLLTPGKLPEQYYINIQKINELRRKKWDLVSVEQ
jgi:hypothetical protein